MVLHCHLDPCPCSDTLPHGPRALRNRVTTFGWASTPTDLWIFCAETIDAADYGLGNVHVALPQLVNRRGLRPISELMFFINLLRLSL